MNKLVLLIILLVLVGGMGAFWYTGQSDKIMTNKVPAVVFTTEKTIFNLDNNELAVQYSEDGEWAKVNFQGADYELPVAVSASGARYANADESIVFWEHQGEAMLEINGEVVIEGAVREEMIDGAVSMGAKSLVDTNWSWVETEYDTSDKVFPKEMMTFIINFKTENQFSATTDCNNLMGNYSVTNQNISFTDIAGTRMACPDIESNEVAFTQMLKEANEFEVDNTFMTLGLGNGTMTFKKTN